METAMETRVGRGRSVRVGARRLDEGGGPEDPSRETFTDRMGWHLRPRYATSTNPWGEGSASALYGSTGTHVLKPRTFVSSSAAGSRAPRSRWGGRFASMWTDAEKVTSSKQTLTVLLQCYAVA